MLRMGHDASVKNISCVENQSWTGVPRPSTLHSSFPGSWDGPQRLVYASISSVSGLGR